MNTEHIISLARKAGWGFSNSRDSDFVKAQLCFAELVAAEEREACANVAEQVGQHKNQHGIAAAIRARGQS
jgi:hypothetical protein